MADDRPIGVFDSGLGGLTVLSAMAGALPDENLVYFGDTARIPYGSKSRETVTRYSREIAEFLIGQNVKMIVVACNTASAHALEELRAAFPVPVLGVIEPGVAALLKQNPRPEKAAVIATRSTVKSGAYEREVRKQLPDIRFFSKACPLFVPLIEEGFASKNLAHDVIREYLDELKRENFVHIILGCTHYPLLKPVIARMYPDFNLIDSSVEAADHVKKELKRLGLERGAGQGGIRLFVSDITDSLSDLETLFFGAQIDSVEKVKMGW